VRRARKGNLPFVRENGKKWIEAHFGVRDHTRRRAFAGEEWWKFY